MGINMKPREFPEQRRNDPKRRAEAEVFDALVNMGKDGRGIYEFRYRPDGQQVDYALWLDNLGRIAGQVKGGPYRLDDDARWYLRTYEGEWEPRPSPVQETVDGRLEMHDAIEKATGYYNFIAGVLIFPDMERNRDMERLAWNRDSVSIVWGLDGLEDAVERIAERVGFRRPPKPAHSRNEQQQVHRLMWKGGDDRPDDGHPADDRAAQQLAVPGREPAAVVARGAERGLVIGHATFNIAHVEHLHLEPPPPEPDIDGRRWLPEE